MTKISKSLEKILNGNSDSKVKLQIAFEEMSQNEFSSVIEEIGKHLVIRTILSNCLIVWGETTVKNVYDLASRSDVFWIGLDNSTIK